MAKNSPAKPLPIKDSWLDSADHWSTPIMANLLWVLSSVLVVTMPLALVGLLGVIFRWMDHRSPQVFDSFFGTIRRVWLKAYALAALDLAVGGLVVLNLLIFQMMGTTELFAFVSRSVTIGVGILLLVTNVYAWVLVAVWDAPLKQILKFSTQLVFAQPLWTVATAVGIALVLASSILLPGAVFVICFGALLAYVACRGTAHVVRQYVEREDFPLLDLY